MTYTIKHVQVELVIAQYHWMICHIHQDTIRSNDTFY
jgi:hypothetical protein